MGSMQHFAHDDAGYLGWLSQHPGGLSSTPTQSRRLHI